MPITERTNQTKKNDVNMSSPGYNIETKNEDSLSTQQRAKARRFEILEFILNRAQENRGDVTFSDIKSKFENSDTLTTTLQNDLKVLQKLKMIEWVSQGLYRPAYSTIDSVFAKTHYLERRQRDWDLKIAVARECINQKRGNGTYLLANKYCLISQGTSTEPIFTELKRVEPIQRPDRIVTNSMPGILELLGNHLVELTIIGGTPDLSCGAIRPVVRRSVQEGIEGSMLQEWIGNVQINIAILSCSFLDAEGSIYCGDHMEEFRQAIINHPNIDLVILADSTKIGSVPAGNPVATTVKWKTENTWLFIDNKYKSKAFEDFRIRMKDKIGDNFVEVDV